MTQVSWNYRLFMQDTPESAEGTHLFFVAECYYNEKGSPEMHSGMEHNHICGDSAKETREVFEMIAEAFKAPIIELDAEGNFKRGGS